MAADSPDHTVVVHVTPGELLDQRWRIETRIGQGAMGSVYKGRDVQANKLVAVKILAPEHCRKPKVVARFEREAEKMTGLRHPNIVSFQGHGRRGVLPFIVMEFLEGMTLSDIVEKHGGRVGLAETVAIVKQIAGGLAFLHHNGLVHRDIKPQNVFFCVGGRVTILDLGVVRDQANPGLTRPGAMVGTPYYMSPEQILGVEDIDKRTDVYALAAVTFELLTGRPPYLGNNNFEVLYGHKNTPPPDATALVKTVPKGVSQVIIRGLAKKRSDRPDTVTEFVADLEAAAGAKKVDLAKAFPFVVASEPQVTHQKTRLVSKLKPDAAPPPPVHTAEDPIPEASNSDVVSVPGVLAPSDSEPGGSPPPAPEPSSTGTSGEQKTVIFRFDEKPKIRANVPGLASAPPPAEEPPPQKIRAQVQAPPPADERTYVGAPGSELPTNAAAAASDEKTGDNPALGTGPNPTTGQLRVVVTAKGKAAEADLIVDGKKGGRSPTTLTLGAGPHRIRIELEGYKPVERWSTVIPGTSTNLRVFLEKD
ncbi:MAG: serine/threonine-protein kinase [Myxococcaceae bacterium]